MRRMRLTVIDRGCVVHVKELSTRRGQLHFVRAGAAQLYQRRCHRGERGLFIGAIQYRTKRRQSIIAPAERP